MGKVQKKDPDVLIVGAGPTGLTAACLLAAYGIPFRIVDKKSGPTITSNALGIQARTMELFESIGISETVLHEGQIAPQFHFVLNGKKKFTVNLSANLQEVTSYSFLLFLEQSKTERILLEHLQKLNKTVEWETEIFALQQNENEVEAEVRTRNGTERIHTKWLIGADGARSSVRHFLEIPFPGETYENSYYLVDTGIDWDFPHDGAYFSMNRGTFTVFFPLSGKQRYRIIGMLPEKFREREEISFEELESAVRENMNVPFHFLNPEWNSVYRLHHRVVPEFRKGRCFLAGDAAHIHSPAGAQGMNTGIQDAWNLSWKLALFLRGKVSETFLQSYHEERYPIARNVLRTSDRGFSLIISKKPFRRWFRKNLLPLFLRIFSSLHILRKALFWRISQLGIKYPWSTIVQEERSGKFKKRAPLPGERMPLGVVFPALSQKACKLSEFFGTVRHTLIFCAIGDPEKWTGEYESFEKLVRLKYHDVIQTVLIGEEKGKDFLRKDIFFDEEGNFFRKCGIVLSSVFLVRPDGYIAYRGNSGQLSEFQKYLEKVFLT